MAQYWDDKDAHGNKLTDGRVCLVIESDDDPTLPTIRTYGRDKDEVLEKVARTAETAQLTIHRLRSSSSSSNSPTNGRPATPATEATSGRRLTDAERIQATTDLNNPAKSPQAVKALLKDVGVDVDKLMLNEEAKEAARVAQEWEAEHPDFPSDERNSRLLMDRALLLAGGRLGQITAGHLTTAYQYLLAHNILFEHIDATPTAQPDGSPAPRAVRTPRATTYRRTDLRSSAPATQPAKPRYTREQIESMNSAQFRQKMENEPGFKKWYDEEFSTARATA